MQQNSKDINEMADDFVSHYAPEVLRHVDRYWFAKQLVKFTKQFQSEQKPLPSNIEQALINLEEYFDDRSDINKWNNPNPEMNLLNDVLVIKKYFGIE